MAAETSPSKSSVQRLRSAHELKPHRLRDFKLSKDLQFEKKFWDVVGLYLNPGREGRRNARQRPDSFLERPQSRQPRTTKATVLYPQPSCSQWGVS
jgi:hypothetical protein